MLDGQQLFGAWFVLRRRTVVGTDGLEHLFSQMAKLVADDVPHELTERCLDAQKPTGSFLSHVSQTPGSSAA